MIYILTALIAWTTSAQTLWLKIGEARKIPAASDATIRVGRRGVIRAVDSGSQVTIIGLKEGFTSLAIDDHSYTVRVGSDQQREFLKEMRRATKGFMGIRLIENGSELEVHGTLLRFADWRVLAKVSEEFHGHYRFKANALSDVANQSLAFLNNLAKKHGYPVIRFSANPQFTIHIPKSSASLKPEVERLFSSFGIEVAMSANNLSLTPLVRTKVILAEVSKSFSQDFGVQWPSEYKAQVLPHFSDNDGLLLSLRALEAKGQAQVLASPTLICRSGAEAEFHAGGEIPIRVVSRNSHDVIWKQHGVKLKVRPLADFQGAIRLAIESEISTLDLANAIDGIPALKTNRVRSDFDLPGKRTIALSGLLRQELGNAKEGLPLLSNIPILGSLFSSEKYLQHQTELVVFVTPEIHSPDSDEKIEMPKGWIKDAFD